jgi:hypothetical protein
MPAAMPNPPQPYQAIIEQALVGPGMPCVFRLRLSLYADRVALSGWCWRGRYLRSFSLSSIAEVVSVPPDRLQFLLTSGETVPLTVTAPDHWRQSILAHRDVAR